MNPTPTRYRFDSYLDISGIEYYYIVYLSHKSWLFGLLSKTKWEVVPVATDKRALGCNPTVKDDCIHGTIQQMELFIKQYPDIYKYLFTVYIPKMNQLVDRWTEIKAMDEDQFDQQVNALGIVLS